MKNWIRTSLLTVVLLIAIFIGLSYLFNLKVNITPLKNIEFAPGTDAPLVEREYDSIGPRNIIVVVADGMGFSHLSLAMLTLQEEGTTSVWDEFEVKGWHDARCSYGPLTDSAASATAMATGTPTFFDVIGLDPDGNVVTNVFELASQNNYATGIVTDSYIWDATPAAFVAHTKSRDNSEDIMKQMAASELDVLFGELEDLGEDGNPDYDETINILKERFQLLDATLDLPDQNTGMKPIAAVFEEDQVQDLSSTPTLPQLTEAALGYLSAPGDPFILLVECEEMDSASHRNDSGRVVDGLKSLQETLSLIMKFSKDNGETLVIFTADHETGGLAAITDHDYPNVQITWSTKDHTAAVVPLLAQGPGSKHFADVNRNYEIGILLKDLISKQ